MNKEQFLNELSKKLFDMPPQEREKTIGYFSEIIDDRIEEGMNETDAVASLEDIDTIINTIMPMQQRSTRGYSAYASEVTAIRLRDKNSSVHLVCSNNEMITLDFLETDRKKYNITLENGALEINCEILGNWLRMITDFDFKSFSRPFTLAIPRNYTGLILLETSNGSMTASDLKLTGSLALKSSNGRIEVRNLAITEGLNLKTSNGRLMLDNINSAHISSKTSNGRIEVRNVSSNTELTASTCNAPIYVENIFAGEKIELHSSNGRIFGTINDNLRTFTVVSQTSNGKSSLPSYMPGGSKELRVSTSNGRIDIDFRKTV